MHFSSPLFSLAIAASSILSSQASPIRARNDGVDAIARSMMGPSSNAVSWESLPLERSPSDPELETRTLDKRIVYNPPVTVPKTGTVWTAGDKHTVRWTVDQASIPAEAKNYKGIVKLGYIPADGSGGYNLKWTLADNFPITDESIEVTLPSDLQTRQDYIIVLMGDSGNRSKKFTINARASRTQQTQHQASKQSDRQATTDHQANDKPVNQNYDATDAWVDELNARIAEQVRDSILGRDVPASAA